MTASKSRVTDLAITPGGRVGDSSPLGHKGKRRVLDDYVREVAHALMRRGFSKSHAIATAKNSLKRWSRGGGKVRPQVRAGAAAHLGVQKALDHSHSNVVDLAVPAGGSSQDGPRVTMRGVTTATRRPKRARKANQSLVEAELARRGYRRTADLSVDIDLTGPKGYKHGWIYVGGPGLPAHRAARPNPFGKGKGKSRRGVIEAPKVGSSKAPTPARARVTRASIAAETSKRNAGTDVKLGTKPGTTDFLLGRSDHNPNASGFTPADEKAIAEARAKPFSSHPKDYRTTKADGSRHVLIGTSKGTVLVKHSDAPKAKPSPARQALIEKVHAERMRGESDASLRTLSHDSNADVSIAARNERQRRTNAGTDAKLGTKAGTTDFLLGRSDTNPNDGPERQAAMKREAASRKYRFHKTTAKDLAKQHQAAANEASRKGDSKTAALHQAVADEHRKYARSTLRDSQSESSAGLVKEHQARVDALLRGGSEERYVDRVARQRASGEDRPATIMNRGEPQNPPTVPRNLATGKQAAHQTGPVAAGAKFDQNTSMASLRGKLASKKLSEGERAAIKAEIEKRKGVAAKRKASGLDAPGKRAAIERASTGGAARQPGTASNYGPGNKVLEAIPGRPGIQASTSNLGPTVRVDGDVWHKGSDGKWRHAGSEGYGGHEFARPTSGRRGDASGVHATPEEAAKLDVLHEAGIHKTIAMDKLARTKHNYSKLTDKELAALDKHYGPGPGRDETRAEIAKRANQSPKTSVAGQPSLAEQQVRTILTNSKDVSLKNLAYGPSSSPRTRVARQLLQERGYRLVGGKWIK